MGPLCSPVNLKAPSPSTPAWRKGPETASTSCLSPHPHTGQEPGLPRWRRRGAIWTPVVPQSLSRGETVLSQPPRWLNRGCSGAGALNPRLLPAPSACTPTQGPAEGCAGRLPGVGGGGSEAVRALLAAASVRLGISGSRDPAPVNTQAPPACAAGETRRRRCASRPSTARLLHPAHLDQVPRPAPKEHVPREPLSPAGASARALPEGQKQGRPWAPGVSRLEAASQTCTEPARGDGPRGWAPTAWWLQMDHVPVPPALQRPQVYVSALPAQRRRAVPTSSESLFAGSSHPHPTPLFRLLQHFHSLLCLGPQR